MAPMRNSPGFAASKRRSSFSLLSTRRRSFAPKNYTFAPNVTPISYPSDPASPSSNSRSSSSPKPDHVVGAIKEVDELAALGTSTTSIATSTRPRRRGGRKESIDHIPRPPNAFMLFRQNFVHQRHVPGSIETNHNSLSKIVGNCWKALPSKEKKVWEALAEKKKEEHKLQFPNYRFQPKHDPEKKRKRQAARAAVERAQREQAEFAGVVPSIPEESSDEKLQLQHIEHDQEKERAMAARRQQMRTMHNHLGHRRSSSVPLPSETYPGYPMNNNFGAPYAQGAPLADPFNFANPAIAQTPATFPLSNGITLPTLPSSIGGLANTWYMTNSVPTANQSGSTMQGSSESVNDHIALPPHLHAPLPRPVTLSRAGSPRLPATAMTGLSGFGEFSGMSSMGVGSTLNMIGMGPRASRQYHLGQLGRRASSTQPILQHQLASGVFGSYQYNASSGFAHGGLQLGQQNLTPGSSTTFGFSPNQPQQLHGFDGFVGAVAEGFINPFASTTQSEDNLGGSPVASNPNSAPASATASYPAPLAPHAMWYEIDSVDPMTPIQHRPHSHFNQVPGTASTLAPVETGLLNPSFDFGNSSENMPSSSGSGSRSDTQPFPMSASQSAPHSARQANFGPSSAPMHISNSAPGTGVRDSFDFSAFNAFLTQFPAQNQRQNQLQAHQSVENAEHSAVQRDATEINLAQPVPVRKVEFPCVPESMHTGSPAYHNHTCTEAANYQNQYVPEQSYHLDDPSTFQTHAQLASSQQSSSVSSDNSSDASPASGFVPIAVQHQHQYQHVQQDQHEDIVSGHELLDGPVDVNAKSDPSSMSGQGLTQVGEACVGADELGFGYAYDDVSSYEAQNLYQMHGVTMGVDYGAYANDTDDTQDTEASNPSHQDRAPRFSFSEFVHGSPFISPTSAVAN